VWPTYRRKQENQTQKIRGNSGSQGGKGNGVVIRDVRIAQQSLSFKQREKGRSENEREFALLRSDVLEI